VNQNPPVHPCGWMVHRWVVPFSSLPVPGLTKVNDLPQSRLVFFGNFFCPHPRRLPKSHLPTYLPTYLPLDYLSMHTGLLPPPPTHSPPSYLPTHPHIYLHTHPHIYLPTHPHIYLPTYVPRH
jgi:hypothetical protein